MSLDKPGFLSQLKDRIPQPVQESAAAMRSRFLAASKPVQYTVSGAAGVLVLLVLFSFGGNSSDFESSITFQARRGDLDITVLEGGSLEAMQSQEIRSHIKGREGVKILNSVEEGY